MSGSLPTMLPSLLPSSLPPLRMAPSAADDVTAVQRSDCGCTLRAAPNGSAPATFDDTFGLSSAASSPTATL
eukprot:CAMPEP_0172795900 /NCGR_PEP_ID=MMETSP1074-20121228/210716_1 /TAXON_ID=2916 /ORGANISM="Ceratium fusus, Strain PA161109" /LENGTH=71 /DNA_ID=CAMNT_0013632991 /DNA_START=237 /DNA_END=452 /DNA_ORIENTATION=-